MEINKIISEIKVWDGWAVKYKEFVPQFIEEAINKRTWQEWDKKVFIEFFEKNRDQCVSSLQQGYYSNIEKSTIKENWSELAPLLKKIASQQCELDLDTYAEIKKWLRKHTSQNRKASVNRLIASLQPELLCSIVNESSLRVLMQKINQIEPEANLKITGNWFINSNTTLNYFKSKMPNENIYDIMTYPWQTYEVLTKKKTTTNTNEMSDSNELDTIKELLNYKKQIILQGPPGTGKTRLAKELAESMASSDFLSDSNIIHLLKGVKNIATASGNVEYELLEINADKKEVNLRKSTGTVATTSFDKIRISFNNKCWEKSIDGNDDRRACAIAKYIYYANQGAISSNEDNVLIIQFHPSYTYEDFVRGIVSLPNEDGEGILFKSDNKILAKFAEKALRNKLDSQKGATELSKEKWINERFEKFINFISHEIVENGKVELTESVFIIGLDNDAFRYKGLEGWTKKGTRMLFNDIMQAYLDNNTIRQDLKQNQNVSRSAFWDATYFIKTVDLFRKFLADTKTTFVVDSTENEPLKNYVLIIDEINRANLPSVLGELIYALEYRDEPVESIYEYEEKREIILPSNLYIIGTMNTADRSVGHIDYAIKRRFAFVDVLPKDLSEEEGIIFDSTLFNSVKDLFTIDDYKTRSSYLSIDFEPKDVALGHSYFIDKTGEGGSMPTRWQYEIKPILLEYIKDGILKETARTKISELDESLINA